jgi:hypothetical protein
MKVVKIYIPGRFEDAFLYRGWLVAVTEEKSLRFVALSRITSAIKGSEQSDPWPSLLFLRNDWINSEQFECLTRNNSVRRALLKSLSAFAERIHYINLAETAFRELDPNLPCDLVYDLNIYYGRVYFGTDCGLFDADFDWRHEPEMQQNAAERRLEAKCLSTSARYSSINASCGSEGLFTAFDEFGSLNHHDRTNLEQVAPISLRTMWLRYDVVNYETRTKPTLLHSSTENSDVMGFESENRVVTSFQSTGTLNELSGYLSGAENIDARDIRFVFNSSNVFFIHTRQGYFYSLGVKRDENDLPRFSWTKSYKGQNGRIVSAHPLRGATTLIETDKRVLMFAQNNWYRVFDGEVISIKTFNRSRRFQHLACLVKSDGIVLASWYDDSKLKQLAV